MSDSVLAILIFVFVLMLGALFVFEKRRQRRRIARPARQISALQVWRLWRALLTLPAFVYVLYLIFRSAYFDPVVRLILVITGGVALAIYFLSRVLQRNKQEKSMLPPTS